MRGPRGPSYGRYKNVVRGIRGTPNGRGFGGQTTNTICSACGRPVYSYGGGSLWCAWCLGRIAPAGRAYKPVITVRRHYG